MHSIEALRARSAHKRTLVLRALTTGTLAIAIAALVVSRPAKADYPDHTVRIVVPFSAGGGVDVAARAVAIQLQHRLGQPFIVENRAGGGGNTGISAAARSQHDGYTLLITSDAVVTNPALYRRAPFDPVNDLAPITEIGTTPDLLVVLKDSPIKDLPDLIARSKAQPNRFNFGSGALGASPHLTIERLMMLGDFKMVHIPFAGAGPALQGLLSHTTDLNAGSYSSVKGQIDDGAVRALFHAGPTRLPELPDVPTLIESGFPGFVSETFIAMYAPAGTDAAIIGRLSREVTEILAIPEVRGAIEKTGLHITASGPEALRERMARELPMWADVVSQIGLKIQ
jgi:tripartite-type tricarboxylate transporter receptor subunit TctC